MYEYLMPLGMRSSLDIDARRRRALTVAKPHTVVAKARKISRQRTTSIIVAQVRLR